MPKNHNVIIFDTDMRLKSSGRVVNDLTAGKDVIFSAEADNHALNTLGGHTEKL
ncbi:MAG: hypothetical protein OSA07_06725 [Pseudomonadales bacterium]|nr:hypothetical protein [Pseudomonadales bacterium]